MPQSVVRTGADSFEIDYRRRRRSYGLALLAWSGALLLALLVSGWMCEVSLAALLAGLPRAARYFIRLLPELQWRHLLDGPRTEGSFAYWYYRIDLWLWLLLQTSQMAALATLLGAAPALLLCFPASANLAPNHATYFCTRRVLEMFRSVPDLVYALILVWAFGVGPLAGIVAIALHTVGALGKLFAEVVENADMRPWDGVRAVGGTWAQAVRYAIVPQVAPNFLSYVLLRFEINVRGATVIGFVGAGGIGQELYTVISFNYYQEISAIVVLIILTVSAIDLLSEQLRSRAMAGAV
jgi:phosphonate transport system permease protein